jgi:Fe2+ or Zn2+ uptake regulation protein
LRRSKAKLYDLVERIVYLYEKDKLSIKDIESILKAEGYDISKSSIHRTLKSYAELADEYKKTAEETKALIQELQNQPASYQMEAILTMLVSKVFNFVRSVENLEFEDPHELISALNKLSSSVERMQRYREELETKIAKVEVEARKRNIDKDFIDYVKKEIFGT